MKTLETIQKGEKKTALITRGVNEELRTPWSPGSLHHKADMLQAICERLGESPEELLDQLEAGLPIHAGGDVQDAPNTPFSLPGTQLPRPLKESPEEIQEQMRAAFAAAERTGEPVYLTVRAEGDRPQSVPSAQAAGAAAPSISEIPTLNAQEAISAFLQDRQFRDCTPRTLVNYGGFLRRFIGQFTHVPTDHKLIRDLLRPFKGQTKCTYWLYSSAFYGFLEKEYGLPNPLTRLPRPHESKGLPSHLNQEQKVRLSEIDLNPRDRMLINLFSESAVRPGEIVDSRGHPLRFCDIFGDHVKVSGKKGDRMVPVTPQTRDGLLQLRGNRPSDSAIFTGDDGHALTYWGVRKIVNTAFKKADITGVKPCPYTLRHSFAGDFLARGGDLATLQKILGHKDIKTSMIYTHIADQQVADSYRQHGPGADNMVLIAPSAGGKFPARSDPSQQLPDLLDRLIALGQQAQELKHSFGGNGHWPQQLEELALHLQHQANK